MTYSYSIQASYDVWTTPSTLQINDNSINHIRGSVHPLKLMLKAVFAVQVTHGAKIIVIALHTLPADTSDSLLCTPVTYHITVSDT